MDLHEGKGGENGTGGNGRGKAGRGEDGEGGHKGASNSEGGSNRRRNGSHLKTKTCPACGHVSPLARLSCVLCAAKFSVKQTSLLLQQRQSDHGDGSSTLYAELETGLETGLDPELGAAVDPSSAEVSTQSFERLPEAAQIQVMQEKAAHRLLAQTLHQQVSNPLAHSLPA